MIPLYNYTVAVIGFVNTALSITEDGGDLEFEIAVRQGTLRFDVLVDFATTNDTALGISQYNYTFIIIPFTIATSKLNNTFLLICSWRRL